MLLKKKLHIHHSVNLFSWLSKCFDGFNFCRWSKKNWNNFSKSDLNIHFYQTFFLSSSTSTWSNQINWIYFILSLFRQTVSRLAYQLWTSTSPCRLKIIIQKQDSQDVKKKRSKEEKEKKAKNKWYNHCLWA